jgi:hypothetical protein
MTLRRRKAPKDDYPRPWEDRPISRERWLRHRGTLMAHEASPGHRPEEWWIYEKNLDPPECSGQAGMLMRMGELAEQELDILMRKWREVYNKANEPHFSYCIGSKPGTTYAHWLEGEAARLAYYEWAGIPDEALKQFEAAGSK